MIHVCFGLHDKDGRYSKFTGTAILSMFENHSQPPPSVTVHLLHDNTLTPDNRDKFSYIAGRYGQIIKFYNVEEICKNEIARLNELFKNYPNYERFTIGALCRILTTKILSDEIEKVIYLDSDITVNLDINELWQINIADKPLAAVAEIEHGRDSKNFFLLCKENRVKPEDYFNSGVLVINLEFLRKNEMNNLQEGIKFLSKNPQYPFFDQEILNYCFSTKYLKLPSRFNYFVLDSRIRGDFQTKGRICHHYGKITLNSDMRDNFNRTWFSYFEKTSWFNKDVIAHLDEEFRKNNADSKKFSIRLSALISGKSRAFFVNSQNVDALKRFFFIREDEEIIPLENQESFNRLANSMNNSRGKKVFFIFFEWYDRLRAELIKIGFKEWEDFIDGRQFLSDANGVPLNTYELVRAM